jgi:hypothetical protein
MKLLIILLTFVFLVHCSKTKAQVKDSTATTELLKKMIFPTSLLGAGLLVFNSEFEKNIQEDIRNKVGNTFEFKIDDYIQYAPILEMYAADALGVKSKNDWFDQTKNLLFANLLSATIVHSLKNTVSKTRPNGASHSFPSGHTTLAFTNASVLYHEFRETAPALAYSGYVLSTTTGAFRIINNKHWLSDVLFGAGLGILATELVYYIEPLKNFNPFKDTPNITLIPQISDQEYGLYFSYCF